MNFDDAEAFIHSMHAQQSVMSDVQNRFLPAFRKALDDRDYKHIQISTEQLGQSFNIILHVGNTWMAEFAIMADGAGLYFMPVYRQ